MRILEGDNDRLMQTERTNRGVCARCGEGFDKHNTKGNGECAADGKGSYTWAHTAEGMKQLIANLEDFVAKAKGK